MLILAVILAVFVYGIIAAILGTIIPGMAQAFSLNDQQASFIFTAYALGLAIASISVGPLVDNKGKKTGILLGLALITAGLLVMASASSYTVACGGAIVLGVGGGIVVTAANAMLSDVNPARRGTVMNGVNLFFGLGGMVTPLISGNLFNNDYVKLLYFAVAIAAITLVAHSMTQVPPPTGERGFKTSEIGQLTSQPVLWVLALFLFLYVAAEVGVWNWLVKHLIAQGVPEDKAKGTLGWGFALGLLLGRVAVAPILIKVPAATVTLAASVLMAITTYAMLDASDPTAAGVAVFFAGVAMAPVFPTTLSMVGAAFPKATATALGIVITSGWIGLLVSSPIIGAIAESSGLKTALLVLPVFSAIMVLVNLVLRPMMKKAAA
jgi:fucose permease